MIESELIAQIIIGAPNFIGFLVAVLAQWKTNMRLLDKLDRCDCDPVARMDDVNDSA